MPILQYFGWVGASLLALLFAADSWLPKPEARPELPRNYDIRIAAKRTGPEAVTFAGHAVNYGPAPAMEIVDFAARDAGVVVEKVKEPTFAQGASEMSSRPSMKRANARTAGVRMRPKPPSVPPHLADAWALAGHARAR
jgi:hypothetical protein